MSTTKNFQAWLVKARKKTELTYKGLADKSGISAGTIHAIEHSDSSPSLDTVEKLCKALGTSVEAALRVRSKKFTLKTPADSPIADKSGAFTEA